MKFVLNTFLILILLFMVGCEDVDVFGTEEVDRLTSENDSLSSQISQFKTQLTTVESELNSLKSENKLIREESQLSIDSLKNENELINRKLDDSEALVIDCNSKRFTSITNSDFELKRNKYKTFKVTWRSKKSAELKVNYTSTQKVLVYLFDFQNYQLWKLNVQSKLVAEIKRNGTTVIQSATSKNRILEAQILS